MWKLRLYASIAALLIYCQSPALAQPPCMPAEAGLAEIERDYGESPLFEGSTARGQRFLLTLNAETGTWSVLIGPVPGMLCMVDNGDGGKPAGISAPTPKLPGAPS